MTSRSDQSDKIIVPLSEVSQVPLPVNVLSFQFGRCYSPLLACQLLWSELLHLLHCMGVDSGEKNTERVLKRVFVVVVHRKATLKLSKQRADRVVVLMDG